MKKIFWQLAMALPLVALGSCVVDKMPEITSGDSPVVINEAYSNGGRSSYGALDWVELYNPSDAPADVSGFILSDKADMAEKVTLEDGTTIPSKGFLLVDVDIDGGFGLGSGGDLVYLYDPEGNQVDNISFGALTPEEAWAREADGSDTFVVQTPTPAAANDGAPAPTVDFGNLVLNEIDGNSKAIELFNNGSVAIPLAGVTIEKIADDISTWWTGVAANGSIPAGGYIVIIQDNADDPNLSGDGGISAKKSVKFDLKAPDGSVVDSFLRGTEDNLDADMDDVAPNSYQRIPNGTGDWKAAEPTNGAENATSGEEIPQSYL